MIAVVIPSYRVKTHILGVLEAIGPECGAIYVVDDACPDATGAYVRERCRDPRVRVLAHEHNQGVGGATLTGYRAAIAEGARVIVKIDGDGQMDAALIPRLVQPISDGEADYVKGNRFFDLEGLKSMPWARLLGNSLLSFITKLSSGYWHVFDPTNGFTAIHRDVVLALPLDKISRRWFFESDLLFRLGILRAVVCDVPMPAHYPSGVQSSLRIRSVLAEFVGKHAINTVKRIFYNYYLRNFNIASLEILFGALGVAFGAVFGGLRWLEVERTGVPATAGTVMLAALPTVIGVQLLLAFMGYDLQNVPREALHKRLAVRRA